MPKTVSVLTGGHSTYGSLRVDVIGEPVTTRQEAETSFRNEEGLIGYC